MAIKVGCVGQKGGPGKSTFARLIAVGAIKAGATAAIAELDYTQKTILDWAAKREKLRDGLQKRGKDPDTIPRVPCQVFSDVDAALSDSERFQFYVLDAPGRTGPEILRIAEASDIVVMPCNPGADDMAPTVRVFNALGAKGIARDRMLVVLNHIGNKSEEKAAREFLAACGANVLEVGLPEKVIYRSAMTAGLSAAEVTNAALRDHAEGLVGAILGKIMEAKRGRAIQAA